MSWSNRVSLERMANVDNIPLLGKDKYQFAKTNTLIRFQVATITWLTGMKHVCRVCLLRCAICRKHFQVLSSCMTYHQVCSKINTKGATSGTGTTYLSGAHECTLRF